MPPAPDNRSRTRQRIQKAPPALTVPDIEENAAERKRVLNVLAQRRYRQRKRTSRIESQTSRESSTQCSTSSGRTRSSRLQDIAEPPELEAVEDIDPHLQSDSTQVQNLSPDPILSQPTQVEELGLLQWPTCNPNDLFTGISVPSATFNDAPPALEGTSNTSLELGPYTSSTSSTNSSASISPSEVSHPTSPGSESFPDSYLLSVPPLTLLRALLRIATRLNAASSLTSMTSLSPFNLGLGPPSSELPAAWQPTPAQIMVPHHPVVDLLPWPAVRDRMIEVMSLAKDGEDVGSVGSLGLVDFIYDMEDEAEGVRIWGSDPYDEANWEVGQVVFERWWFVFDRRVVERSNYWRRQRGAAPLRIGGAV